MPLLRRRRPLLRAAAVGGGAYMLGKRHAESQEQEQEQDQYEQEAPPQEAPPESPPPSSGGISEDAMARLKELGQLHEQGVRTDEEFAQQKAKRLG